MFVDEVTIQRPGRPRRQGLLQLPPGEVHPDGRTRRRQRRQGGGHHRRGQPPHQDAGRLPLSAPPLRPARPARQRQQVAPARPRRTSSFRSRRAPWCASRPPGRWSPTSSTPGPAGDRREGRPRRPRQRPLRLRDQPGAAQDAAGGGRGGVRTRPRAQAARGHRHRRLPERGEEHADLDDLLGQAEDRRLPLHDPRRRTWASCASRRARASSSPTSPA